MNACSIFYVLLGVVCACSHSKWLPSPGCDSTQAVAPRRREASRLGPANGHKDGFLRMTVFVIQRKLCVRFLMDNVSLRQPSGERTGPTMECAHRFFSTLPSTHGDQFHIFPWVTYFLHQVIGNELSTFRNRTTKIIVYILRMSLGVDCTCSTVLKLKGMVTCCSRSGHWSKPYRFSGILTKPQNQKVN